MDFDYSDDQRYLRDEARRFLDATCPASVPRAVLEDPAQGHDPSLWSKIAAQGWLGVAVPESHGGLGLSHVELAAIAEEVGAALAPVPFGSTLYLFAEAIRLHGLDSTRSALLPEIVGGALIGCAALTEGPGDLDFDAIRCRVADDRLFGVKMPVPYGNIAEQAVVLARHDEAPKLFLVRLDDPAVQRTRLEAIDGSIDIARLEFTGARIEPLAAGRAEIEALIDGAAVLTAFEQVGAADRCLALTVAYVKERAAFGGPLGRFQAIKHKLADLYVTNQIARSHAYHGVWAMGHAPDRLPTAAAAARVAASDAFWQAAREMVHLHGATGFTWEHDAHQFYRRAHHQSLALGSSAWWRDRLADALVSD